MKQGEESTKFMKNDENGTEKFILQKNKKTKIVITMIAIVLALIIIAIIFSGQFLTAVN